MSPQKPLVLAFLVTIVLFIVFSARYGYSDGSHLKSAIDSTLDTIHPGSTHTKDPEPTVCEEQLAWLEPYQFTYPIQYVSRTILARPRPDMLRPPLTIIDKPLFDKFSTIDLAQSKILKHEKCLSSIVLDVPHGTKMPVDASNMIFGLQTTMGRLRDTVQHLARWLPHTGARLYAIVKESDEPNVPAADNDMRNLEKEFRGMGMDVTIMHPVKKDDSFPQRYFSLVNVMYGARDEKTQWISTIDDDTFFPSMWDLQNELKKHDWTQPHYVGSLSEDWWAVKEYGLMGFGGAGVFLSLPMAEIIHDHNDNCKYELIRSSAGDITLMDCVYKHSSTKLTHIAGLHQIDLAGDLSGFYESGRDMLSVHHWKQGFRLEMEKLHRVADICDSCFLQRFQFSDDLVLTNGFSIASYPQGHLHGKKGGVLGTGVGSGKMENKIEKINLLEMEKTWGDDQNVLHSLAPLRDALPPEAKIGYKFLDSTIIDGENVGGRKGEKVVRQIYFKEGGEVNGKVTRDTVMVLNWRSDLTLGLDHAKRDTRLRFGRKR